MGCGSGASAPIIPVQTAVLHRLGDMLCRHAVAGRQIRDRGRDLQDPVMRAGGETHSADGHFERPLTGVIEICELAQLLRRQEGVVGPSNLLPRAGPHDAFAHLRGSYALAVAAQFLVSDGGEFDAQIDAVKQRAGDIPHITLDNGRRTAALLGGVTVKTVRTGASIIGELSA